MTALFALPIPGQNNNGYDQDEVLKAAQDFQHAVLRVDPDAQSSPIKQILSDDWTIVDSREISQPNSALSRLRERER